VSLFEIRLLRLAGSDLVAFATQCRDFAPVLLLYATGRAIGLMNDVGAGRRERARIDFDLCTDASRRT
jgi:hypothetical protein